MVPEQSNSGTHGFLTMNPGKCLIDLYPTGLSAVAWTLSRTCVGEGFGTGRSVL